MVQTPIPPTKQTTHYLRIRAMQAEMRRCLKKSEQARDLFYATKDAYETQRGLTSFELDKALDNDRVAQGAIADSQLYDRWTIKYASVIQAEIAAFNIGLH